MRASPWWTAITLLVVLSAGAESEPSADDHSGPGGQGRRVRHAPNGDHRVRSPPGYRAFLKGNWKIAEVEMEAAVTHYGELLQTLFLVLLLLMLLMMLMRVHARALVS